MNTKITRTILILLTLLMPLLLWWTRTQDLPSMSAFADAPNNPFYHAMHVFASWFFILQGSAQRRNLYYWIGFGMGGILFTNMYLVHTIHNTVTAVTMGLAIVSMIIYSTAKNMASNIFMTVLAVGIFALGLSVESVNFFFAEFFTMLVIAVHMVKKTYLDG